LNLDQRLPSVDLLAKRAKQRIPHYSWEYFASGTNVEYGLKRSTEALQQVHFVPRMLGGKFEPDINCELLGHTYSAPFGIAPVGMTGAIWPRSEIYLARAAREANIPQVLSMVAAETPEVVKPEAGDMGWFQFYPTGAEEVRNDLLERARACGYKTLVVTVDVPVGGTRERLRRVGLQLPPKVDPITIWRTMLRPRWTYETLQRGLPRLRTLEKYSKNQGDLKAFLASVMQAQADWDYIARLQDDWDGPVIVKGLMAPEDAIRAAELGLDGIVVSTHGARQIDGTPAAIEMLPRIAEAVGGKIPILFDSGLRSGLDIARALALGADFCLLGRAFLYGVGAVGEPGAAHVIKLLRDDLINNMIQLGTRNLAELREREISTHWD
jgi:L-lactate dehydrogenase (cytochrome)